MLFPSVNRQKSWLLFLLAVLVSTNIYFHSSFNGTLEERARWLDGFFSKIIVPFQRMFLWAENSVEHGSVRLGQLLDAENENRGLREQIQNQDLMLQALEEVKAENLRLKTMLEFKTAAPNIFLAARVIGRDISLLYRTFEIDRGTEDGVLKSMAVVSPEGVVGRILRAEPHSSTVLLVNDVNSALDGVVQRSRTRVIVGGAIDGDLKLRFLPRRWDLRQGDVIVTSGLDGRFPAGFKMGVVIGIAHDPNFVLDQAVLEPALNLDSLEEVFIVKTKT